MSLQTVVQGDRLSVIADGSWTAAQATVLEPIVDAVRVTPDIRSMALDLRGIAEIDTFGACLLERLVRRWRKQGKEASVTGLADRFRGLVAQVDRLGVEISKPVEEENAHLATLEGIGRGIFDSGRYVVTFLTMLGAVGDALLRVIADPRRLRFTSLVNQLDRVGLQAVPIVLLITFLIGGIIAQQGIFHFRKFGAESYAVDLVGILVLREIGVLIVAIMVAGRSGSSYTAELGSMKMREEIDALRTMGLDPAEVLILPRVIALVCALPILTFLGSLSALYGGGVVAWLYGGMSPAIFIARLKDAISVTHFEVGMIKAPFMALVIGIVACAEGLKVKGSAESLGLQTTSSVVKSIFLVIVLDGFFAIFFASIGM
jgi:phospholipid/cholesterol/gamma-HCH transport system permease protein